MNIRWGLAVIFGLKNYEKNEPNLTLIQGRRGVFFRRENEKSGESLHSNEWFSVEQSLILFENNEGRWTLHVGLRESPPVDDEVRGQNVNIYTANGHIQKQLPQRYTAKTRLVNKQIPRMNEVRARIIVLGETWYVIIIYCAKSIVSSPRSLCRDPFSMSIARNA